MFDIGWSEILLIAVVALVAIGPKELPRVLFEAGKWFRRIRLVAGEFQRHFTDIMHEAELDELRKQAQAARDVMRPKSLADLIDPGGAVRDGFDPTVTGAAGYSGSPVETPVAVSPPLPQVAAGAEVKAEVAGGADAEAEVGTLPPVATEANQANRG